MLEETRFNEIAAILPVQRRRIGPEDVFTVTGRDIQRFLESTQDATSWCKDQNERGGFIENTDFIILTEKRENSGRGRPSIDYCYTTDAAKTGA
jgi:anti-repressor protein